MNYLTALIIPGVIIYLGLLWTFICFILSLTGGWMKLSKKYKSAEPPSGEYISSVSGRMRFVNYNFILRVSVSHNGFYLYVMKLFRPFHPVLFIPWGSVRGVSRKTLFWLKYLSIEVNTEAGTFTFMLTENILASKAWNIQPRDNA
jgi:hypothetical protein